jgi:ABC-2 type transport system permease protein
MRSLAIAWKDVRHVYRSFSGLAMMLLAPLLLAGAIGAAFGSGDNFSISPVKTVVVDLDSSATPGTSGTVTFGEPSGPAGTSGAAGGRAGAAVTSALTGPGLSDLLAVTFVSDAEVAKQAVDNGEAEVAVIVPAGLTQALASAAPTPQQIQIYKDPTATIGPEIVSSVVQEVVQSLNGARAAASAGAQLAASHGVTDTATLSAIAQKAAQEYAARAQSADNVSVDTRSPVTPGGSPAAKPNTAGQVLIGMMLFFTLFGAATPARSIIEEQRLGTLPRLFTTPTSRTVILAGKYLAVFAVVLLQTILLLVAGRLLFGAQWGAMGPVIALVVCGALVASSLGLLTVSWAKTPAQAGAGGAAIFVFLGLISGNFVGTTNVGGVYAVVRRFSPMGWLIEGWNHVMFGGSWASVAVPLLAALAFALVFFALATFFFRRRYA